MRMSVLPSLFFVWLFEDGVLDLHRDGARDAFAHVQAVVGFLEKVVDALELGLAEGRQVGSAVGGVLAVDEAEVGLAVGFGVGERELRCCLCTR